MPASKEVAITLDDIKKGEIVRPGIHINLRHIYFCSYQKAIVGECHKYYHTYKIIGLSDRVVESFKIMPKAIRSCCGVHLVKIPDTTALDDLEKELVFNMLKTALNHDNAGLKYIFVNKKDNVDTLVKLGFKKNRELKGGTIEYIYPTKHYSGC